MDNNGKNTDRGRLASVVISMNVALKNLGLYGAGHSMSTFWTQKATEELLVLLSTMPKVTLKVIEGDIIFEGDRLFEDALRGQGLVEAFSSRGVESITFLSGLEEKELITFLELLKEDPEKLEGAGGIAEEAKSRGLSHILVESLHYLVEGGRKLGPGEDMGSESGGADLEAREVYLSALSVVRRVVNESRAGRPVPAEDVSNAARKIVDQVLQNEAGLTAMTSVKTYDEYTFQHCVNLSILSLALGSRMELKREKLIELGLCALLHDVGKVFVPAEILHKPGRLSQEEWGLMEKHPADGARLLVSQPGLPVLAPVVAYEHHLKNDLSGYPKSAQRKSLNLFSSIVAIADCYDALTTPRSYRQPLLPKQAVEVMQEATGKDFEPRLLNYFTAMLGPYPAGSCVRLAEGQVGLVTKVDSRPPFDLWLLPLLSPTGESVRGDGPIRLLARDVFGLGAAKKILEAVDPVPLGLDVNQILTDFHRLKN